MNRMTDIVRRYGLRAVALFLALYAGHQVWIFYPNVFAIDFLLISGVATFILGLHLARGISPHFDIMLSRLFNRGALRADENELRVLKEGLVERAEHWAGLAGCICAVAVFAAFAFVLIESFAAYRVIEYGIALLALPETLGGYVVGRYLGRMACYGSLANQLRKEGAELKVEPGHLDQVGGLQPIGEFFFYQAKLVSIPAAFIAIWSILIPIWPYDHYMVWRLPYLGLLAVALSFVFLSFVWPLWTFHGEMKAQKVKHQERSDCLSREIASLRRDLTAKISEHERRELSNRLSSMIEEYNSIEQLPTWPVDVATRRWFTVNNIVLSLPLVNEAVTRLGIWDFVEGRFT